MASRLWHMNADFEMELAAPLGKYRRPASFDKINQRLAAHLLWLAAPGDALLLDQPWSETLRVEASRRGVELVPVDGAAGMASRIFTPWGWTASVVALGERIGATVQPVPLETVARVNSKLFSHSLELEMDIALPGAATASTFQELQEAVARACPKTDDKWVIKSPLGFAARDRVLGRGPTLIGPPATWSQRRLASGETLIFQPWLDVIREYGVTMNILPDGEISILGISDLQTNGAGTGKGYLLGRKVEPHRAIELERIAKAVGERLWREGYAGPAGVDALEHTGGLHPLLEINARHTMGFVAMGIERPLGITTPVFWDMRFPPKAHQALASCHARGSASFCLY